jgi:hypothetical protein
MPKSISGATLLTRLKKVIGRETSNPPSSISVNDPLSDYFDPVPEAVIGFGPTLNDSPEFQPDGLGLMPKDLRNASIVGDVHESIKQWYGNNGWTVS